MYLQLVIKKFSKLYVESSIAISNRGFNMTSKSIFGPILYIRRLKSNIIYLYLHRSNSPLKALLLYFSNISFVLLNYRTISYPIKTIYSQTNFGRYFAITSQ